MDQSDALLGDATTKAETRAFNQDLAYNETQNSFRGFMERNASMTGVNDYQT